MQKHVPFFMLAALLSLSQFAFAIDEWKAPTNVGEVKTGASCSGTNLRCKTLEDEYTRGSGATTQAAGTPMPCSANWAAEAQQIEQACQQDATFTNAMKCCSGKGDACINDLPQNHISRGAMTRVDDNINDATQLTATQNNQPLPAGQLQQACQKMASTGQDVELMSSSVAGACHARKAIWMRACQAHIDRFTASNAACNNGKKEAEKRALLLSKKLDPTKAEGDAKNYTQLAAQSMKCQGGSAANPRGGNSPGGNGNGSGSGSGNGSGSGSGDKQAKAGGGGMNPAALLGPLMQLAAMAAQQPPATPPQQPQMAANLDKVDCTVNPNLAGCPTAAKAGSDSWNVKTAALGEASASDAGGGFNPADENSMRPAASDGDAAEKKPATPTTVGTVANNSGGSIPGGGGGGAASLGGGGAGGGGAPGASKTDVLHGLGSGGGGGMSAMAANMNMKNGEGSGGYTYGQGNGFGNDDGGLDLSQFLPGGKQDPSRKVAGIAQGGPANFQIQSKDVNIFSRISERIRARCSQGLLRDCIP